MKKVMMILFVLLISMPAMAVQPDEMLKDPLLEARARDIGRQLRCLVCQGEDIDESNADLARDLRKIVRQRVMAGDDDAAVLEYVRARYGDYVLMNPPVKTETFVLWFLPFVLLGCGFYAVLRGRKS